MDKTSPKFASSRRDDLAVARKAMRKVPVPFSLLALPDEVIDIVLWKCSHSSIAAIGSTCCRLKSAAHKLFDDEHWVVSRVPLHLLLHMGTPASDALAAKRLEAHPDEAASLIDPSAYGGEGRGLPLHLALDTRSGSTALLLALIRAHPAAVFERCTDFSMLPLEHAAERRVAPEVIFALMEAHLEQQAPLVDGSAMLTPLTALHLAVINGASDRIVRALLRAAPEAADLWGCENAHDDEFTDLSLLHLAAVYGPKCGRKAAALVHALCVSSPRAASTREGRHGMLPLHLAALSGARVETIKSIWAACPDALRLADDHGRTPLDCARAYASACSGSGVGALGSATPGPGYTYRKYAGLNTQTLERLAYRETTEHAVEVVACLEALVHLDELVMSSLTEHEPVRTWRYSYAEGSYGQVLQEEVGAREAVQM
jgi:hypothetical protein